MAMANISQISHLDEEHKSEKIVYKRRSSIFLTRIITCDQQKDGNEATNNETRTTSRKDRGEDNVSVDAETFNLKEYIEKLRQERKDWQREYRNRKAQRKDLIKQKASIEGQGQILDMNVLTESERVFLTARPNYEHICINSQKLLDITLKISTLSQLVHNSNKRFMERMENNISRAIKNVIKMSE